jgi:hypothetical protein
MKIIVNETQYNKLLKEERGFSKSSEDWSRVITDEVMKTIFDINGDDVVTMTKLNSKYGGKDFFKELPIESIIVTINVERVEGEEGGADGAYIPKWSHLEDDVIKNKDVVEDVEFDIIMKLPKTADETNSYEVISDHLFQIFSHELLHVNEWYNRDLENPAEMTDCMGLYIDGDLHGNAVEKLAYMIYTQLSFEMNAFIHQAGTMLRMRDIRSYDEFIKELHSLVIWDFVEAMLEFNSEEVLKEIGGLGDKDKELLNNIKICYYSTKNEDGEITINPKSVGYSTERFLDDMSKRFKVRGTAMKRKLHKIATDVIKEGDRINEQLENITITGEKVSDFDIELDGQLIRRWSKNNKEHVERVQKMLISLGYDIGSYGSNGDGVDGKYGKYTEKGVKEFQEDMMPEDPNQWDGVMGPITYNHLKDGVEEKAEDEGVTTDYLVGNTGDDVIDTPNDVIDIDGEMITSISDDIDVKKGQLFQAGSISLVWEKILNDLDDKLDSAGIKYKVTAGNDNFHKGKNSRHNIGCAVDWAVRPTSSVNRFNKKYAVRVYDIMDKLTTTYGDEYDFSWIDEYNHMTKEASGAHIHMSISREFCGVSNSGKENTRSHTLPKDAIV